MVIDNVSIRIVVNIYVIHYAKLEQRSQIFSKLQTTTHNIVNNHKNISFNIEKVSKFDPHTLTNEFIKRIFESTEIKEGEGNVHFNKFKLQTYQPQFMSNCLKHLDALKSISKNSGEEDINIILEDDALFDSSFETEFVDFVTRKLYENNDIIFLGFPSVSEDTEKSTSSKIVQITEKNKIFPCCESYYVSKSCAHALIEDFIPIRYPYNIQLSYLIDKKSIKMARYQPNMFLDGSKTGLYPSSISSNNVILFNLTYKNIYTLLSEDKLSHDDIKTVRTLLDSNKMKNSPDFIFLEGLFYLRTNEFEKSKEYFDKAIQLYELHNSPLNNQSMIIQNYIELCRQIQ